MSNLTADRFGDFLAAVHDDQEYEAAHQADERKRTPFPWQQQLLEQLLEHRDEADPWPTAIDAPTGLGKTSVLDVAVFAAAAGLPLRRVFFVVDRRIVVDEAYDHAQRLERRVHPSGVGILGEVGERLAALTENALGRTISATRMRGGITWDWRWMDRPDRFGIVVGTVDQVGSRLLFRGYGLSHRLAPIDAALVGADSVLFVDEAHLAEPMIATIAAIQRLDRPEQPVCRPASVVQLSATRRATDGKVAAFDVDAHLAHPEAGRRLRAAKILHPVATTEKASADVLAASALAAARLRSDTLVGVVVNTVAKARAVFDQVHTARMQAVLLTGRQRPWDRDRLLDKWKRRITVGWREYDSISENPRQPVVVVATQCIEVGANLDLDVLITESAPWDSLVQRIGRVNRVGAPAALRPAPVVVVHAEGANTDLVYGEARTNTWEWLTSLVAPQSWKTDRLATAGVEGLARRAGLDVSPLALRRLPPHLGTTSASSPAPVLFPQHLEGWVRTAPVPIPDAPVAPFLHGFADRRPAVRVLWRADLAEPTSTGEIDVRAWRETIATIPPRAEEEIELPLPAVRAWLRREPPVSLADDDAASTSDGNHTRRADRQGPPRPALRIGRRDDQPEVVQAGQLQPDDRIIVPAAYGGLDEFGWAPTSTASALDIADVVARRRPVVRLHRRTLVPIVLAIAGEESAAHLALLLDALEQALPDDETLDELPRWLPQHRPDGTDPLVAALFEVAESLAPVLGGPKQVPRRVTVRPGAAGTPAARLLLTGASGRRGADTTVGSSVSDQPVPLDTHHRQVGEFAAAIAYGLRLPESLIESVRLAGAWHDLGKLDPRFQTILFAGVAAEAEAALLAGTPRAKSGIDPGDWRARRAARDASRYPRDGRHEALSAVLVRHRLSATDGVADNDLVEHLVAAHHGYSRPLLPPVPDAHQPREIRVPEWDQTVPLPDNYGIDWSGPCRFRQLGERYGLWGLALLEAIVRLADIACSAGEHNRSGEG